MGKARIALAAIVCALAACRSTAPPEPPAISDREIGEAYVYLVGRLAMLSLERADLAAGFRWNEVHHLEPSGTLAVSRAWIAVDQNTCTLLDVPEIAKRYATVQIVNTWGETLANVNERTFPDPSGGTFALCLPGALATLPEGARRIDVSGRSAHLVARIERGKDPGRAAELQRKIAVRATGRPNVDPLPTTPEVTAERLPGAAAFDAAPLALEGDPDINPGAAAMQETVRAIAAAIASDPAERARVEKLVRPLSFPVGRVENGWSRPDAAGRYGPDFAARTLAALRDPWTNVPTEVVAFETEVDGATPYTMTFPEEDVRSPLVRYFWAVEVGGDGARWPRAGAKLRRSGDGTLTLHLAAARPGGVAEANWIPAPRSARYRVVFRCYGPGEAIAGGRWFPPPLRGTKALRVAPRPSRSRGSLRRRSGRGRDTRTTRS